MISTIPFPSFKELNWRSRATFGYFIGGIATMIAIVAKPEVFLFLLIALYIASSLIWNGWRLAKGKPLPGRDGETLRRSWSGTMTKVAVVGATGAVGKVLLDILEERRFPISEWFHLVLRGRKVEKSPSPEKRRFVEAFSRMLCWD